MLMWFRANLGNILVLAVVITACALAIRSLLRQRRQGGISCGGSCGGCGMSGICHSDSGPTPLVEPFRKDYPPKSH